MAEFFLQNVMRRRPLPPFFCHACKHRFSSSSDDSASEDPVCPECGSDFVERVDQNPQEEQLTTGGGDTATSAPTPSTTTSTTIRVSRPGLRSTTVIEEDVPMETVAPADDPEPEIIRELPRRRPAASRGTTATTTTTSSTGTTSTTTSHDQDSSDDDDGLSAAARMVGGPYVRIHAPNRGVPMARMIYEHIENLMSQHRARDRAREEGADMTDGSDDTHPPAARRHRQHSSPPRDPPEPEQESEGDSGGGGSGADLHFAVGLPWYLMLHGRDHARWSQPQQSRGQPRPHNPQVPRFGMPLVIGFNSGPVHGTPGDYAWGPSGLDDIITQMLANLEDSGPPPAKEEKIAELPKIVATEEDLRACAECSVCKEHFTVGEELLKIPCNHLYHTDCVIPWLKLHDTCPTCRYHLNTGKYEQET